MQVLIVEDQPSDLRVATTAAQESGFADIEARSSIAAARDFLQKALDEGRSLPDAIVLDLDLGYESGFELLRYWHSNPQLSKVSVVVWTILGNQYREICEMFKVTAYLDKGAGGAALRNTLAGLKRLAS
ncbi:MAG TPA: response regulator [Acidobacteriaceae bacterium]|nr:response regulator [Acidobacteriaceae bacterium]